MVNLHSCLATQIQNLIDLRCLSGTDYHSQAKLLEYFDHFLIEHLFKEPRITSQIIDDYQHSLLPLAPRSRNNRFCVVKQLCEYLAAKDPQSYVPDPIKYTPSSAAHKPYIYTLSEIRALLTATTQFTPTNSLRPHTYCTLLGLLYCTGIRIGEAFALDLQDFNRTEERLLITAGKFHKARWLPLASSACRVLERYLQRRCQSTPHTPDSPLFVNLRHRRLHHGTVSHDFYRLLQSCGITHNGPSHPRIHDLRHTFAVHRLLTWYRNGDDVNAKLPALATYMGHVNISSTQVYLRPTTELLNQVQQRFYSHYLDHVKPIGEQI